MLEGGDLVGRHDVGEIVDQPVGIGLRRNGHALGPEDGWEDEEEKI